MSKIGRQPIKIPETVSIEMQAHTIRVSGPKGTITRTLPKSIIVKQDENLLKLTSENSALWGTWRAHIANLVIGVTQGFEKTLEIHGVGYRVSLQGSVLTFQLGFSHPITISIPEDLSCEVKENTIIIRAIDKEKLGEFSASIRSLRPPDAYKGKGIRYQGEEIRLKPGKKAGVGAGA